MIDREKDKKRDRAIKLIHCYFFFTLKHNLDFHSNSKVK